MYITTTTNTTAHPAAHTTSHRAVRAAMRSEWIKIRSTRTVPALVALTGVVGIAMSLILGTAVKTDPYDHLPFTVANTFYVSTFLTTLFAIVAGTLLFTSEVQHGTLGGVLTARPARRVVVIAKAVAAAGLGLAMGAIGLIGGLAGGLIGGIDGGDFTGAGSRVAWGLVLTTMAAVLGVGVGMIVRHSAAAVTAVLVWALAVENIIGGFAPVRVSRLMPFSAAHGLLGTRSATDTAESLDAAFTSAGNALLFGTYTAVAVAVGGWLLARRDV